MSGYLQFYTRRIVNLMGESDKTKIQQVQSTVLLACAQNPYLLDDKVDTASLILAVMQGLREGVTSFSGAYAQAYLVPFGGKVTLIRGYKGMMDTAMECGAVRNVEWGVVREGDKFDYEEGTAPFVKYQKCLKRGGRKELICTWNIVTLPSGDKRYDILTADYLERIEREALDKISQDWKKKASPWMLWPDEMYGKTSVRHALKAVGLNPDRHARVIQMIQNDDRAMSGDLPTDLERVWVAATQQAGEAPTMPRATAKDGLRALAASDDDVPPPPDDTNAPADDDPLASLRAELAAATGPAESYAVQMRWLPAAEESLKREGKALCEARTKELAAKANQK